MTSATIPGDIADAIQARRSVRGFLPQAIPPQTLEAIFSLAQAAPSNCNVQPWRVYVASGDKCVALRDSFMAQAAAGTAPAPDFGDLPVFEGEHRSRQVACAAALYGAMGIERDDKFGRLGALLRNFELFDAPHVAFIGMPRSYGVANALDVGIYLQTLLLAMTHYGVASCAQLSLSYYPDLVRDAFGIAPDMGILVGISFGYEDTTVAANNTRCGREELGQLVTFAE